MTHAPAGAMGTRDPDRPGSGAPIFIVGCRRSGTTLMSRILDAHPRIAICHETFLYPIFKGQLRWYGDLTVPANRRQLAEDVRVTLSGKGLDAPNADDLCRRWHAPGLGGVFGAILQWYASHAGKARGGDKTPGHHAYLEDLTDAFPASPILFMIRDPRDTVLSIRRAFGGSVAAAADVWIRAFEDHERWRDRVHTVRYEELVTAPEQTIRRVTSAIGESYDPAMLAFHRNTPESMRRPGGKLDKPIDAASVGRYRRLPARTIARVEALCGGGMQDLGYEFDGPARAAGRPAARAPSRLRRRARSLIARIRYYGLNAGRWRQGAVRWRLMIRARARFVARAVLRRDSAS